MLTPQEVLKRIILHNRLLPPEELDALLTAHPDPEDAVKELVQRHTISAKTASQLLAIYKKQVAKMAGTASHTPGTHEEKANNLVVNKTGSAGTATLRGDEVILRLLKAARAAKASDIHIMSGAVPVGRIAGILRDLKMPPIPSDVCERALLSLLTDEQKRLFLEKNDLDFCYDGGEELGRFRANYLRHQGGMDGIFRVIPKSVPRLDQLGLPPVVRRFIDYRQGIVLVTGPKGCGKTSTLAAMVDEINSTRHEHIITIEDPIEFVHPCKKGHVNQREVGRDTRSFSNALRAALREAPDVIMVGEMRDLETTQLAITAAETGHLVLATLHTPNAVRTVGRILDVFPPREQGQIRAMLSESLRGIISQQLITTVDGRSLVPAVEILINTTAVAKLIRDDRAYQVHSVIQTGKKVGMILMDDSLIQLVRAGKISKRDALARAEDPARLQKELG